MALRMASPWKHPSTGMYWFRRRVPEKIQARVGCKLFTRSLRTKDVAEAKRLYLQMAARIDREWTDLLDNLDAPARPANARRLTPKQMQGLAGEFYRWLVARHDEDPGSAKDWQDKVAREKALVQPPRSSIPGRSGLARASHAMTLYGPQVERFLEEREIIVDEGDFYFLSMAIADAGVQAKETLARNARGDYSDDPRATRFPKWEQVEPTLQTKEQPKARLTIEEHFDAFAAESLKPASRKKYRSCLRDLERSLKSENLNDATPEALVKWKDDLSTRKHVRRSVEKIGLNPRSVRDGYLAAARSFYDWAVRNKKIDKNPMDGITMKSPKNPRSRPAFEEKEEAMLILSETLRPAHAHASPEWSAARRWVPWICAYTGARVNEITQLRGKDVRKVDFEGEEFWAIAITPEAGTVKNGRARRVPLHPHIAEQGFPAFVASRGDGPLFYDPGRNRGGSIENPPYKKVGDKLAEWVRQIGVDREDVSPNHGWRHRFQKIAQKARMVPEIRDAIKGHVPRTEGEEYGGYVDLDVMWAEIKLLPRIEVAPPTGPLPESKARREATKKRAETRKRAKERAALGEMAIAAAE